MATNPTAIGWSVDQPDRAEDATFFEKLGAETETKLEDFFQWWGCHMASKPWVVLFIGKFFCNFGQITFIISHVVFKKSFFSCL